MAEKVKGITLEIGGETLPLQKALKSVNADIGSMQGELKKVERLLKLDPSNTEILAQKQKLLSGEVDTTKSKLEALKNAKSKADTDMANGTEINEKQYRELQREIVDTENKLEDLEKQAKQSNVTLSKVSAVAGEFGEKAGEIGRKASIVSAAIVGIGAASQAAWVEVDEAADTIITKTGAAGEAAESLTESFKNVASTLPTDLQNVGDAIGEVNTQFGFMGSELEGATEKVIKFAEINGQDVSQTAIQSRQAIEAFGLSAEDLGGVLDAVTKTAQNTGQATTDLFTKVTDGAPQTKALGLDFAQATAMIGNFEQKGVDSAKALSYLSKAQVNFAKDGKTLEQGLDEVIGKIQSSTNETDALTAASEVFGTKGAVFMVDAIKRGALSIDDLKKSMQDASGAVEETFEGTLDPADEATIAMNNLKLAGADLTTAMQTVLAPMMEKIVEKLKGLMEWFGNLSPGMKEAIVIVGGIVAAIGPLLIVIGSIANGISVLVPLLGALTGPIGLVIAAIVGLIAVGVLLYKNWDTIKEYATNIWTSIVNVFTTVVTSIKNAFSSVIDFVKNNWQSLLLLIFNPFAGAVSLLYKLNPKFKGWVDNLLTSIKQWLLGIVDAGKNIVTGLWNGISGSWNWLVGKIKEWCGNILDAIKAVFGIHSPSRVMRDEVGKMIVQGVAIGIKENSGEVSAEFEKVLKDLSLQKDLDVITTEEYYAKLEKLRDEYLEQGTEKWWEITKEIMSYQDTIFAEQKTAIEKQKQDITTLYSDMASSAISDINNIKAAQDSLADKLSAYGELYSTVTTTFGGLGENGEDVSISKIQLNDLSAQTQELIDYKNALLAVKERGDIPQEFFDVMRDMSIDEGTSFAEALLDASDEDFREYIESWKEKQRISNEISKELYADETNNLKTSIEESLANVPEIFSQNGIDSATSFFNAFMEKFNELKSSLSEIMTIGSDSIKISGFDGFHARGLDYVPYDGYSAILHKGEAVVNASSNPNNPYAKNTASTSVVQTLNFYTDTATPSKVKRATMQGLKRIGALT